MIGKGRWTLVAILLPVDLLQKINRLAKKSGLEPSRFIAKTIDTKFFVDEMRANERERAEDEAKTKAKKGAKPAKAPKKKGII